MNHRRPPDEGSMSAYSALMDAAPAPLIAVTAQGLIRYANRAAAKLSDYAVEELIGQKIELLIPPASRVAHAQFRSGFADAPEKRSMGLGRRLSLRRKDGTEVPVEVGLNPVDTSVGPLTVTSITDLREQLKEEQRLRLILDAMPIALIAVAGTGIIEICNSSAAELFGYSAAELVGERIERLVPQSKRSEHQGLRRAYQQAPTRTVMGNGRDVTAMRKDGSELPVEVALSPIETSKGRLTLSTIVDLSERQTQAEALQAAKNAADQANRAKTLFLANMSHEIRTPMNSVLGYLQLLASDSTLNPSQKDYVQEIETAGQHLLQLVSNVLDLSRIEAGAMSINARPFDLIELLESLQDEFCPRCAKKGLRCLFEIPAEGAMVLNGDATKLRQILANLLDNAVKFTSKGAIKLNAYYAEGFAHFEVSDSGPGINDDIRRDVLEAFYQRRVSHAEQNGSGLGLSIVDGLLRVMGSRLLLESKPGIGTAFHFELELPRSADQVPAPLVTTRLAQVVAGQEPVTALVADDTGSNRRMLTQMLESIGVAVIEACDGDQALTLARQELPDIVFLDVRMPGLSGDAVVKKLRADAPTARLPCVAVTASSLLHSRNDYLALGFDELVAKPFEFAKIYHCLETLLQVKFEPLESLPEPGAETFPAQQSESGASILDVGLAHRLYAAASLHSSSELEQLMAEASERELSTDVREQLQALSKRYEFGAICRYLSQVDQA